MCVWGGGGVCGWVGGCGWGGGVSTREMTPLVVG